MRAWPGWLRRGSLVRRLAMVWALSLLACVGLGLLLVRLSRESTRAQLARASAELGQACAGIRDRYEFFSAHWRPESPLEDPRLRHDLAAVVGLALERREGLEGGIWHFTAGPLSYAFPTYEGTGPKTDLPAAERELIESVNVRAAREGTPVARTVETRAQALLLHACPLPGPVAGLTGWTMTRVHGSQGLERIGAGLAVLLVLFAGVSFLLTRTLQVWTGQLRGIASALDRAGAAGIPDVPRTGERELDRVLDALARAGERLEQARAESEGLAARASASERLAAIGRMTAGVAHEIRNPLAALRLQAENALAGDDRRRSEAIGAMLAQVSRLDALVSELLATTQRQAPSPEHVEVARLLEDAAARHADAAASRKVRLLVDADGVGTAIVDPTMVGRILDNLVTNGIRHAGEGGSVRLSAEARDGLELRVEDSGPGVDAAIRPRLFEPFVTGRPDGTGLGLAIARELADAHGGSLRLDETADGHGARFVFRLPG